MYHYLTLKCRQKSINLIWFRIFYVFGNGQRQGSLIPTLIDAVKSGETPNILNPFNKNDFIYIKDVAEAFLGALETNVKSGIYNLGNGYSTSVVDICKKVELFMFAKDNLSRELDSIVQKGYLDFWADISKTKNILNWKPQYSLDEGIKLMIKHV